MKKPVSPETLMMVFAVCALVFGLVLSMVAFVALRKFEQNPCTLQVTSSTDVHGNSHTYLECR